MDPVKLDEIRNKRKAELMAQLEELKAELKKLKEERYLPSAKVIEGAPNKLSQIEKLRPFIAEAVKKRRAALREGYINREPLVLRLNSQEHPCCTTASPPGVIMLPAFSEDEEGKEARTTSP
ncbi:unnamed protein product [Urochloa humidicola]